MRTVEASWAMTNEDLTRLRAAAEVEAARRGITLLPYTFVRPPRHTEPPERHAKGKPGTLGRVRRGNIGGRSVRKERT